MKYNCAIILLSTLLFCTLVHTQQYYNVGTGVRSVLPTVNGNTDYVVPMSPFDCCDAGTFVSIFDVGQVAVGNGEAECHWVRDNIKVRVATIGPDAAGFTLVMVASEVYMLFRNDLQEYYEGMRLAVGDEQYNMLYFFVHAQHNHEGPDTSGLNARPINHEYYSYMIQQMIDATMDALGNMKPAILYHGAAEFYYGLGDHRDPTMQDSTVRVVQAYPAEDPEKLGAPIATLVNWGMHPEITLGYTPIVNQTNCSSLPIPQETCSGRDRVFTHDYPGHLSEQLSEIQGGGEVLYFNGAIGNQIGNWGVVWEPTPDHPVGNGSVVPPGAEIVPWNFRAAYLIGRELALYINQEISLEAAPIAYGEFEYHSFSYLTRTTNWAFRVGLVPQKAVNPFGDPNRPFRIGNTMRPGYICPNVPNPTIDQCTSDNFEWDVDSVSGLPYRKGSYMETEVRFIRLGHLKIIGIPGELAPEVSAGLPKDFDTPKGTAKYFENPDLHATSSNYVLPGVIMDMMACTEESPCWPIGLCGDEIGYIFPISDWRIYCDHGTENCTNLFEMGAIAFFDSASGEECKLLLDNPDEVQAYYVSNFGEEYFALFNSTCIYGQAQGEALDHYEETNSASWDSAGDLLHAVSMMLGVNPTGRYCETTCPVIGQVP